MKNFHTHSDFLSTAARSYSSEKHAPLQSAERKQLTSGAFFLPAWAWQALLQLRKTRALPKRGEKTIDRGAHFFCTHPPPSPSASPAPRRVSRIFDFRLSGIKGVEVSGSAPVSKECGKFQPLRALCLSLSRYRPNRLSLLCSEGTANHTTPLSLRTWAVVRSTSSRSDQG